MKDKRSSIQVIDRAVRLLDSIARNGDAVSLKILSAETGLHPSTAFRILASLVEQGFVDRAGGGRYRLGIRLLQLSSRVSVAVDVRHAALPIMEWLRDQVDETVNLTVRHGDEVVYVERVTPRRMMRVEQVIGSRAPLHVTAVGKLMLAEDGPVAVDAYARRTGLSEFTRNTLTNVERLQEALLSDHRMRYSLDNEEAELGVGCIGVLVRDDRGAVAAGLSVSAPIERRSNAWVPLVEKAGRRISAAIGYRDVEAVQRATA